jgi:hypothetical protein
MDRYKSDRAILDYGGPARGKKQPRVFLSALLCAPAILFFGLCSMVFIRQNSSYDWMPLLLSFMTIGFFTAFAAFFIYEPVKPKPWYVIVCLSINLCMFLLALLLCFAL